MQLDVVIRQQFVGTCGIEGEWKLCTALLFFIDCLPCCFIWLDPLLYYSPDSWKSTQSAAHSPENFNTTEIDKMHLSIEPNPMYLRSKN